VKFFICGTRLAWLFGSGSTESGTSAPAKQQSATSNETPHPPGRPVPESPNLESSIRHRRPPKDFLLTEKGDMMGKNVNRQGLL
jgi:hypothetical protein